MSISLFDPFRALYHPASHKKLPWWVNNHQHQGNISRWTRADRAWEVSLDTMVIGEITVRRLDLDECEDYDEVQRLREARGWYGRSNYMETPMALAGLQKNPAIIERIPLSNERFAMRPRINPCSTGGYSQMAPRGTGPGEKMTYSDVSTLVDGILLRIDREFPIPMPPVWRGQVWRVDPRITHLVISPHDIPEGAGMAILYGPTCYGRDVPWLNASLLPESV